MYEVISNDILAPNLHRLVASEICMCEVKEEPGRLLFFCIERKIGGGGDTPG